MKSIIFFLLCIGTMSLQAQRICQSTEYANRWGHLTENSPVSSSNSSRDTVANEIITIPVVVHIIYNNAQQNISDAQVISQLKVINEDFRRLNADAAFTPSAFLNAAADSRIMFCLAQVDPRGRPKKGIIRKQTTKTSFTYDDAMKFSAAGGDDAWDARKYLNIWVCNMQGNSLGYATEPGSPLDKDGVVIQYNAFGNVGSLNPLFNKGRTATHEIGHWLGLKHIWGDDNCGNDYIDDTPTQESYNNNCPSFPHLSACSPNANGDMFMNFMDYTNDACMNMFTNGQKSTMRGLFAVNGYRNSFMFSFACDSSLSTGAPLPTPTDTTSVVVPVEVSTIKMYPNPVHQTLHIASTLEGIDGELKLIRIFNTTGKLLLSKSIVGSSENIDLSALAPGIYIVHIGVGKSAIKKKLIKI